MGGNHKKNMMVRALFFKPKGDFLGLNDTEKGHDSDQSRPV
jgi:hypothetical protein